MGLERTCGLLQATSHLATSKALTTVDFLSLSLDGSTGKAGTVAYPSCLHH